MQILNVFKRLGAVSGWRAATAVLAIGLVAASGAAAADHPLLSFDGATAAAPAAPQAAGPRAAPSPDKTVTPIASWDYVAGADFSQLGAAVSTVGDLNGDGYGDAAVGAPNMRDPTTARVGAVLVFYGSATGLPATPSQIIYGPHYYSNYVQFGAGLSPAGDVNGDGYGDLLVGAPGYAGDGAAFVYLGSAGGLQDPYAWSWTLDDFTAGSARLGEHVATAGDVNGDGYDDIVLGTGLAYVGQRGKAVVFLGGVGGLAAQPAWDVIGANTGDAYGAAVAGVGDVDGDGYADVAVGAPGAVEGGLPSGDVLIYRGGPAGLAPTAFVTLRGTQAGANFGAAVSGAGDMNGDGYADVGVGAPGWDSSWATNGGYAAVYRGAPSGMGSDLLWTEYGSYDQDQFGQVLAPAGDVNGDGLGDLAVGAPNMSNGSGGHGFAAVVTGARNSAIYMSWWHFDTAASALYGGAVGTGGDVDGDGFSDILVGSSGYTGTLTLEGRAQMYRGAADAPSGNPGWSVFSAQTASFWGWSMAPAGDVNGDGYDDMLATGPNYTYNASHDGIVLLYLGGAPGVGVANWYAWGPYADCSFGYSASGVGDLNGDGYDDIAIGAPDYGNEGFVSIWYGSPTGPTFGPANMVLDGFQAGSHFGTSVAGAGDVNGDGYADLIVGAPNDDGDDAGNPGPANEGKAYLYLGSAAGVADHAWSVRGGQAAANLGNSVAGAGDVNGDGYADVIVGMEAWDRPLGGTFSLLDVGRALIFTGGPGGLAAAPATTLEGNGNDNFGHVVATAGDVDGDGYSDVLVTAVYSDPSNQGSVAVFRGSAAGVGTTAYWSFTSGQANSACGSSAASAGDVNGDGLSDVIVGSVFGDNAPLIDNGRAWVFAGPLSGTSATTPLREFVGIQSYQNLGNVVAGVGDLNGDGFADLAAGSPGYSGGTAQEGRADVFYGNGRFLGNEPVRRLPQQRRGDNSGPVALGGATGPGNTFVLQAWSAGAAGRIPVRLEWQVEPLGTPYSGVPFPEPWTDSAPLGAGSSLALQSSPIEVPGPGPAHWRVRVASRSPYFPHSPWLSPVRNGAQETDLRWPSWLSAVDGGDGAVPSAVAMLQAAPNPFNPRTRLSFTVPRAGRVRIALYDVAGRLVAQLADGEQPAGTMTVDWDGRDGEGRAAPSGVYLVRAEGDGVAATAKIALVR